MNKRKQGAATRTTRRGRAAKTPGAETGHKSASGAFAVAAECTVADAGTLKSGLAKLLDDTGVVTLDISSVQRIDTAGLQVIATFVTSPLPITPVPLVTVQSCAGYEG